MDGVLFGNISFYGSNFVIISFFGRISFYGSIFFPLFSLISKTYFVTKFPFLSGD